MIDALLFVFGYRANKMRQGKLSELIHNSAKHPNCSTCSVEIHFQEIVDGVSCFPLLFLLLYILFYLFNHYYYGHILIQQTYIL